jgi:hypothetical protein
LLKASGVDNVFRFRGCRLLLLQSGAFLLFVLSESF